jgi:hypothetical protein
MAESRADSTAERRSYANNACPAAARDGETCGQAILPRATFALPESEIPDAFRELADIIGALASAQLDLADVAVAIADCDVSDPINAPTHDGSENVAEHIAEDLADDIADDPLEEAEPIDDAPAPDGDLARAAANATAYSLKITEAACVNASALVAFANELLKARSLSQIVELSTSHAARQIETIAEQTKQLATVAQIINRKRPDRGGEPAHGPDDITAKE